MTTFKRKGLINIDSRSDIRFWAISVMGCNALIILLLDREQAHIACMRTRVRIYVCDVMRNQRPRGKLGIKGTVADEDRRVRRWLSRFILTCGRADSCGEMCKRLSRTKLPFPTSGQRYARMMPPLSWWRTSENLPKNVTSVQRTVTEDFSED